MKKVFCRIVPIFIFIFTMAFMMVPQIEYVYADGDEVEPNDTKATANEITLGGTVNGSAYDTDVDYYKFTLADNSSIVLDILFNRSFEGRIRVVSSDGTTKAQYIRPEGGNRLETDPLKLSKGTYYLIVSFIGGWSAEYTITLSKAPSIADATVTGIANKTYTGKAITQNPVVKWNGQTLKKGTDYTVSYKNNVNVGTATVIITGKGSYTGTVKKTFKISKEAAVSKTLRRAFGDSRYTTAFGVCDAYLVDSGRFPSYEWTIGKRTPTLDAIVVASGENFPDALAASYFAAAKKAPVIVWREKNNEQVQHFIMLNLKIGGKVYLMGGTGAVSANITKAGRFASLMSNYSFTRLGGDNRYGTNTKILSAAKVKGGEILVCDGTNFEGALIASATGKPVLLVKPTGVTREGLAFIAGLKNPKFTIIGNEKSVSEAVATTLSTYGTVTRITGTNPDQLSVNVAKKYFKTPKEVVVATSKSFPDGLCGGVLSIQNKAPLLLVNETQNSKSVAYTKTLTKLERVTVLGGTAVVSDSLAKKLLNPGTTKVKKQDYDYSLGYIV